MVCTTGLSALASGANHAMTVNRPTTLNRLTITAIARFLALRGRADKVKTFTVASYPGGQSLVGAKRSPKAWTVIDHLR
jgi:hypothetical protein